jgi:hypothetical protein
VGGGGVGGQGRGVWRRGKGDGGLQKPITSWKLPSCSSKADPFIAARL